MVGWNFGSEGAVIMAFELGAIDRTYSRLCSATANGGAVVPQLQVHPGVHRQRLIHRTLRPATTGARWKPVILAPPRMIATDKDTVRPDRWIVRCL
jgi:hypothetical protein